MKKIILFLSLLSILPACNAFREKVVYGKFTTKSSSGWSDIRLYDKDGKSFRMTPGIYVLRFGLEYPFSDPSIAISDINGKEVGIIKIPKNKIKSDGTFELYMGDSKNSIHTNILGGRREIVLSRHRYVKIRQSCSYTETHKCTDSDGKRTTCTEVKWGDQDAIWETRKIMSIYKIIFDGSDMVNGAIFEGQSDPRTEEVELSATTCS